MTRYESMSGMGRDEPREASVFSIVLQIVVVLTIAMWLASSLGVLSMAELALDMQNGGMEEPTLADYEPVEKIEKADGSVIVTIPEDARLATRGSFDGGEVTHIQMTRADGAVVETIPVATGRYQYGFVLPANTTGDYTVVLQHRESAEPGLFGHEAYTESQVVRFEITSSGDLRITDVPFEARYE